MFSEHKFNSAVPIYLQIMLFIQAEIFSCRWAAGQRVPPVRELALNFGVNPNTVQRALTELERDGFLYSERTSGRFVTENIDLIKLKRNLVSSEIVKKFKSEMYNLGYTDGEISELLNETTVNAEN